MAATIIDGKALSLQYRQTQKARVEKLLAEKGVHACLAVIIVGEDPASQIYVRNKVKACEEANIKSLNYVLDKDTTQADLLALVNKLNADDSVHGILVQLPVPKHIDDMAVIDAIDPKKDVDGFHVSSAGALMVGKPGFVPCTARAAVALVESVGQTIKGMNAVIVGRSNIVGKPAAMLLLQNHATVTVCHSRTADLAAEVKRGDIVIATVGVPHLIKGDMIKDGAIVIDVGINRLPDGKIVGDVDTAEASKHAAFITPVPGGVGPMTIAMLLENTVDAAERYAK